MHEKRSDSHRLEQPKRRDREEEPQRQKGSLRTLSAGHSTIVGASYRPCRVAASSQENDRACMDSIVAGRIGEADAIAVPHAIESVMKDGIAMKINFFAIVRFDEAKTFVRRELLYD